METLFAKMKGRYVGGKRHRSPLGSCYVRQTIALSPTRCAVLQNIGASSPQSLVAIPSHEKEWLGSL